MVDAINFGQGSRQRMDTGKSASSAATYNTEDEGVDVDELNERMQSFPQDILEMSAIKNNLPQFKIRVAKFVEKRTAVMVILNRLARQMAANDAVLYQLTEKHKRSVKQHELRARNICVNIQQEKGPDAKIIEFFDDQIKKYEFQLGITPGILEQSLVRENQQLQEQREFTHKKPMIDENVDMLDLGTQPQTEFKPPPTNNFGPGAGGAANMTLDNNQNQTIKLGQADESRAIFRPGQLNGTQPFGNSGVNDTNNDTIGGLMVAMNKEENDRSETGGEDYQNEDWLRDKRAENMDIGGPGGTGSSSNSYKKLSASNKQLHSSTAGSTQQKPIRSYMEGSQLDDKVSAAERKRKTSQLEKAMPAEGKSKACADCTIF